MVLYTAAATWPVSIKRYGIFIGGTIHDVAQVLGRLRVRPRRGAAVITKMSEWRCAPG